MEKLNNSYCEASHSASRALIESGRTERGANCHFTSVFCRYFLIDKESFWHADEVIADRKQIFYTNGSFAELEENETKLHFAKYGFEVPEFECEILKEFDSYVLGYFKENTVIIPCTWYKRGGTLTAPHAKSREKYNLTPLKKEVEYSYEVSIIDKKKGYGVIIEKRDATDQEIKDFKKKFK